MRTAVVIVAALSISACTGGDNTGWQPSDNAAYAPPASPSDTLIRSGVSANSYDATLAHSPSLYGDSDAHYVGQKIRAHDEMAKNLDSEVQHRLGRQF